MKTALLIGASGLVGSNVLKLLLDDPHCGSVIVFVRNTTDLEHPKLTENLIDFDNEENWRSLVKGDILFSALATTIRAAGSREAQYKVDFTYQFAFAKAAAENGVRDYVLCSSAGADPKSWFFYLRMKGELEEAVKNLGFDHISFIRPAQLQGRREEPRPREEWLLRMVRAMNAINFFKKYEPISGEQVARAMIQTGFEPESSLNIYKWREVFDLADKYMDN